MADSSIKNLPPEERIKKLKELEAKRKKEIEEAQKLIRETEEEMDDRWKWKEKVPIPQVAKEDLKDLSPEEKDILKTHKGLTEKAEESTPDTAPEKRKHEPATDKEAGSGKSRSLEETISQEQIQLLQLARNSQYEITAPLGKPLPEEYLSQLSQRPMGQLYQEMASINREFEEKGYLSREDERRVEYLTGAVQEKIKAVEAGRYSLTEEVALAASLTQSLGSMLRDAYKRK